MGQKTGRGKEEDRVEYVRKAIEHRATWFYLLWDEAQKKGIDFEEVARAAVYRCGCLHGEEMRSRCPDPQSLRDFQETFVSEPSRRVFSMETVTLTDHELMIHFNYCPLVAAWKKLGCPREDLPVLCDVAMDGDRGILSKFDSFSFQLGETIAAGHPKCVLKFTKKRE